MSLTINHVEQTDFGNYRCVARNDMAMLRGAVTLEGEIVFQIIWSFLFILVYGAYVVDNIWTNLMHNIK